MVNPIMTATSPDTTTGSLLVLDKRELRLARGKERSRQYYQEHKEEINARNTVYMRLWRKSNADRIRARVLDEKKRYYQRHRSIVLARNKSYKLEHPEQFRQMAVKWKAKVKLEVLSYYGGGTAVCARCGYSDIRALTIDHMNGGGSQHRLSLKRVHLYPWLKRNNSPDGYQTLCMNCQFIKKVEDKEYGKPNHDSDLANDN